MKSRPTVWSHRRPLGLSACDAGCLICDVLSIPRQVGLNERKLYSQVVAVGMGFEERDLILLRNAGMAYGMIGLQFMA